MPPKTMLAEYEIRAGFMRQAAKAVMEFLRAMRANEPGTRIYEAYRRHDSRRYVHLMQFESAAAERVHASSDHVRRFVAALYPLCVEPVAFTGLDPIGEPRARIGGRKASGHR